MDHSFTTSRAARSENSARASERFADHRRDGWITPTVYGAVLILTVGAAASSAQQRKFEVEWEAKAHYRDSEDVRFASPFPFTPAQFPVGEPGVFLRTVDPGENFEVSTVTLKLDWNANEWVAGRLKIDALDLHDRNPTSDDREIDVDELWVSFGTENVSGLLPAAPGYYVKLGKFAHFERQNDRHLESYGLVATAFNRFEDAGVEVGADLGRHVYLRGSFTQGNPLFIRDPNALAGDNGTERSLRAPSDPERESGIVIAYDAEVEYDIDFEEPEVGAGVGFRFGDERGRRVVDLLGWHYERDLADTVDLEGTLYGADLDLLLGPGNAFPLPISGRKKEETGLNLWLYWGNFSAFGQIVDQELAGMTRKGTEVELAWRREWSGRRFFTWFGPAVRYSEIDPEFDGGSPQFPAVSVRWDWDKWDYGVRLGLTEDWDLTVERAENTFVVKGQDETMAETLVTVRWRR